MKIHKNIITALLVALLPITAAQAEDRAVKQKQLDQACEAARERKLAPEKAQYIEECVAKQRRDRAYCERFYSDYGARSGNRAPLYYDLPECVEAFEYGKSYRKGK